MGLYRAAGGSSIQQYDDVKIGYDNNSDDDLADAGAYGGAASAGPADQRFVQRPKPRKEGLKKRKK